MEDAVEHDETFWLL